MFTFDKFNEILAKQQQPNSGIADEIALTGCYSGKTLNDASRKKLPIDYTNKPINSL